MPEKKSQHFVPKFFIKRFADCNGYINTYIINRNENKYKIPYDSQCKAEYYYGSDLVWENKLGEMETLWSTSMLKIEKNVYDDNDINQIKIFAIYQYLRARGNNEFTYDQSKEFIKATAQLHFEKKGYSIEKNKLNGYIDEYSKQHLKNIPQQSLEMAKEISEIISDLDVVIIDYKTKSELIISDNPIITINRFVEQGKGFGCLGLIIFFPISPHQLLVLYDSKMYPLFHGKRSISNYNEQEVQNLNVFQYISAEKILLFKNSQNLINFPFKNASRGRRDNLSNNKMETLGSNNKKMMVFILKTTVYDCNLSFATLLNDAKKIPYPCREAVPRKREKEWEDKLKNKCEIMPLIQKNNKSIESYTIKDIRKGCEMMLNLARAYWQNRKINL